MTKSALTVFVLVLFSSVLALARAPGVAPSMDKKGLDEFADFYHTATGESFNHTVIDESLIKEMWASPSLSQIVNHFLLIRDTILPILDEHQDNLKVRQIIDDLGGADPQIKEAILRGESQPGLLGHFARLYHDKVVIKDSGSGLRVTVADFVERTAKKLSVWFDKREYDRGNPETQLDSGSRNEHWVKTVLWFLAALVAALLIRFQR